MVVKLGTLILEASVFQQSPRFLLLQLGLTDRHQLQAGVLHQLCEAAVALLASVNILLPGIGLETCVNQTSHCGCQRATTTLLSFLFLTGLASVVFTYLQVKQGELCFIKELLVLHFLGKFPAEFLLSLQGQV